MPTIGQQVKDHQNKGLVMEDDVIEYRRMMEPDIIKKIHATIADAKTHTIYQNKDFYIVKLILREKTLAGTPRNMIFARQSCPTPVYRQSTWKYHHLSGSLEFLWTIPDRFLYYDIVRNAHQYLQDKETRNLARFVLLMESGELLQWVKKECGELKDAVIKISATA
jgi:hypothetical protein